MKQLIGLLRNQYFCIEENEAKEKLQPRTEVIAVFVDKGYVVDIAGKIDSRHKTETVRFIASPDQLRMYAKSLNELADTAEHEQNDIASGAVDL